MGHSGSGKSTLMAVLGCLDRPTSGRYFFEGTDVAGLSEPDRARLRSERLGFVFQSFNLLARTSAHRKRGAAAVLCRLRAGERGLAHRARALGAAAARLERPRAQYARPALGRPAAAGGDRARADQPPRPAARRRADRQSRYPHLARYHGDADQAQPRAGRHHRGGHPRSRHRRICRPRLDHARRRGGLRQAQSEAGQDRRRRRRKPSRSCAAAAAPAQSRAPMRPGPSG